MPDIDISNVDPAEINFNDLDTLVDRVPHDWFAWLRRNAPVFRNPDPGGPGFWVITRYEDVVAVGRDHRLFSNAPSHVGLGAGDEFVRIAGGQNRLSRQARGERPGDDSAGSFLLTLDPPEHTTYRTILNRDFTPRRVRALEGRIRELESILSTSSPTLWPSSARPTGDSFEILPSRGEASALPTSL